MVAPAAEPDPGRSRLRPIRHRCPQVRSRRALHPHRSRRPAVRRPAPARDRDRCPGRSAPDWDPTLSAAACCPKVALHPAARRQSARARATLPCPPDPIRCQASNPPTAAARAYPPKLADPTRCQASNPPMAAARAYRPYPAGPARCRASSPTMAAAAHRRACPIPSAAAPALSPRPPAAAAGSVPARPAGAGPCRQGSPRFRPEGPAGRSFPAARRRLRHRAWGRRAAAPGRSARPPPAVPRPRPCRAETAVGAAHPRARRAGCPSTCRQAPASTRPCLFPLTGL
ncbi:hypothetical protein GGR88_000230 [Sphingomonas jejuensis]|uniref:Uncharacterized protein n=1 Tax=Sphingomonas jejuensis TaxID=904715 RepID=A0ABX0XHF1_9SPHN|nr:hypothetical protein [Sphingomonas jejuensis]